MVTGSMNCEKGKEKNQDHIIMKEVKTETGGDVSTARRCGGRI